jgi:hypothetical protein
LLQDRQQQKQLLLSRNHLQQRLQPRLRQLLQRLNHQCK